jgi:peptidoglycan/LPS O-acetylase OafA/YrhL
LATPQDTKFIWLDFVRGLSAIAVCASHLRAALFVDYSSLVNATLFQKAFYLATGLGHQAVMVFFVLSGFFVGGSVLRSGERFRPGNYAIARLSRLWIVLVPALLLTAIVDHLIAGVAPGVLAGGFEPIWHSGPVSAAEYSASPLNFLANLAFLQTIVAPVFGTNGPLWSLANEFWYYVLFPLCAMALGWALPKPHGARVALRIVLGALALGLLWLLPTGIVAAYPIWLLGLVAYFLTGRLAATARRLALAAGLAAFAASLAYSKAVGLQDSLGISADLMIGAAFCLLCVALANMPGPRDPHSLFVRTSRRMSAFSYSLYLVHFPLVAWIGAGLYGAHRMAPGAVGLAHFAGWLLVLLAAGIVFWWLFERRTDLVRHTVTRWVKRNPKVTATLPKQT